MDGSGRDTASSGGTLAIAVGTIGAAAVGAGAVVANRANLTLCATALVGSGVVASRTTDRLAVGASSTS